MLTLAVVGWIAVAVLLRVWVGSMRREAALERELHEARISLGLAPAILTLPQFAADDEKGYARYREWAGISRS